MGPARIAFWFVCVLFIGFQQPMTSVITCRKIPAVVLLSPCSHTGAVKEENHFNDDILKLFFRDRRLVGLMSMEGERRQHWCDTPEALSVTSKTVCEVRSSFLNHADASPPGCRPMGEAPDCGRMFDSRVYALLDALWAGLVFSFVWRTFGLAVFFV